MRHGLRLIRLFTGVIVLIFLTDLNAEGLEIPRMLHPPGMAFFSSRLGPLSL